LRLALICSALMRLLHPVDTDANYQC